MKNFDFYFCKNCGFHNSLGNCLLQKIPVDNDDSCSRHIPNNDLNACRKCGRLLTQPIIVQKNEKINTYCKECYRNLEG